MLDDYSVSGSGAAKFPHFDPGTAVAVPGRDLAKDRENQLMSHGNAGRI